MTPTSADSDLERFDAPVDVDLPSFDELGFVGAVETTRAVVEETYYDTADRHLARAGLRLTRRKGGDDPGWRVTLPAGHELDELRVESRATTAPRELSSLLLGVRGGQRLIAVERVSVSCDTHLLTSAEGEQVAIVRDELRTTSQLPDGDETVSRSIELEHGPESRKRVRKPLRGLVRSAGASRSAEPGASEPSTAESGLKRLGGLVDAYVQEQLRVIAVGDLALRRGVDVVHPVRVAIRRLRSTLHVFADLFDDTSAAELDTDLTWLAVVLGRVRDCDVVTARVSADLSALPDDLVGEGLPEAFAAAADEERSAATEALTEALSSRRYANLVGLLEQWRVDPPYTEAATKRRRSAEPYVVAARKLMRRRLAAATRRDADRSDVHRARKAAKRFRYAAELASPVLGKSGRGWFGEAQGWQDTLGEFQDSVLAEAFLTTLGLTTPSTSGPSAFTYGILAAQELTRGDAARARIRATLG